jgi:hypothetical protein
LKPEKFFNDMIPENAVPFHHILPCFHSRDVITNDGTFH